MFMNATKIKNGIDGLLGVVNTTLVPLVDQGTAGIMNTVRIVQRHPYASGACILGCGVLADDIWTRYRNHSLKKKMENQCLIVSALQKREEEIDQLKQEADKARSAYDLNQQLYAALTNLLDKEHEQESKF